MTSYSVAKREQAADWMAEYPDFGEMRSFTDALDAEEVAFTWRRMPPGTGGKGSYGHRHKAQEELYFVIRGNVQFKVGDDVFEAGPLTAVRVHTAAYRSIHNDGPDEAEVIICAAKAAGDGGDSEKTGTDFWPE
jgi:mannose-6-phosphate isomerase-like protein (cupin superfamily)